MKIQEDINWIDDLVKDNPVSDTIIHSKNPKNVENFNKIKLKIQETIGDLDMLLKEQYKIIPTKEGYDQIVIIDMLKRFN